MEAPAAVVLAMLLLAPGLAPVEEWLVVTYDGPLDPAERRELDPIAGPPLAYVPPFGFLVRLSPGARAELEASPAVASVREVPVAARISKDIGAATDRVRILLYPDADPARFAADMLHTGAATAASLPTTEPIVDLVLGRLALADVFARPEVRWVEPARDRAELDNERASSIVQSGTNAAWRAHDHGVDGSSQLLAYCDSGLDTDAPLALAIGNAVHEMFADAVSLVQNVPNPLHRKVALYYSPVENGSLRGDLDDANSHGTHVGGTLAGDAGVRGARDGHDGVAYGSRLVVCDAQRGLAFQVLADYRGYWQPAYDAGARIHSNSWGTTPSNEYSLVARQHDAYAWEHRDFLILRSMGNTGPDGLMRPEAVAKNVLAIGSTENDAAAESVAATSGRGPADDGRMKPDLVAPGRCVTSALFDGPSTYECWSGTSHATPVAAGAATLVRDYFAKGLHEGGSRNVSSALVRAMLVASAERITSAAPDTNEGWGRPELDDVLAFEDGGVSLLVHDEESALETGSTWSTTVNVASGSSLRIVLAWTDAPASPGASPALVNDLDLEVLTPSGAVLLGNSDLTAPDRANVIERVLLPNAAEGTYTLRVRGWNVPMGPQPFALVAATSS
ncbi:MAG TPA: S8 family serine peptidase [Candidatus Thermoplasmatota archaeon]|nr:S8 family serine peptidase [Candidatus Thermoplasmatota archaeon]